MRAPIGYTPKEKDENVYKCCECDEHAPVLRNKLGKLYCEDCYEPETI